MEVIETLFKGLKVIVPQVWKDDRGYFYETYSHQKYKQEGIPEIFCQDNEAFSTYGVVRGLHYQKGNKAQGKLVRILQGEVLDVVVDLRKEEATYGKSFSLILNDIGKKQLYVPPGFAHGYAVLSKIAIFSYKCTTYYHPQSEAGIHPHDPSLDVDWIIPIQDQIISEKDKILPLFGNHDEID